MSALQYRWYSRKSNAEAFDPHTDFNAAYYGELGTLRQFFGLRQQAFGLDKSTNQPECWKGYRLKDLPMGLDQTVLVKIARMEWGIVRPHHYYYTREILDTAQLDLVVMLAHDKAQVSNESPLPMVDAQSEPDVFQRTKVIVRFEPEHPKIPPRFIRPDRPSTVKVHSHHWYDNGQLCIAPLRLSAQWRASKSLPHLFGFAVAWLTWHFNQYGY